MHHKGFILRLLALAVLFAAIGCKTTNNASVKANSDDKTNKISPLEFIPKRSQSYFFYILDVVKKSDLSDIKGIDAIFGAIDKAYKEAPDPIHVLIAIDPYYMGAGPKEAALEHLINFGTEALPIIQFAIDNPMSSLKSYSDIYLHDYSAKESLTEILDIINK